MKSYRNSTVLEIAINQNIKSHFNAASFGTSEPPFKFFYTDYIPHINKGKVTGTYIKGYLYIPLIKYRTVDFLVLVPKRFSEKIFQKYFLARCMEEYSSFPVQVMHHLHILTTLLNADADIPVKVEAVPIKQFAWDYPKYHFSVRPEKFASLAFSGNVDHLARTFDAVKTKLLSPLYRKRL